MHGDAGSRHQAVEVRGTQGRRVRPAVLSLDSSCCSPACEGAAAEFIYLFPFFFFLQGVWVCDIRRPSRCGKGSGAEQTRAGLQNGEFPPPPASWGVFTSHWMACKVLEQPPASFSSCLLVPPSLPLSLQIPVQGANMKAFFLGLHCHGYLGGGG